MRIAIIINLFPPKWLAGTELATYHLAEHLAKKGHEIHVITSQDEGTAENSYEKGFYIHRLSKKNIRFLSPLLFWKDIFWIIQRIKPDIVHGQDISSGIPALLTKKLLKIPFLIYGRGTDVYDPDWFAKLTIKTIIKNADSVIALTSDMKKAMQAIYDRDISVISNGIELNNYTNEPPVQNVGGSEKRILFVGRLHPIKGVQYLLQAMQIVHAEMPDVRLILVGDGEEREYLESLTDRLEIRGCVEFAGRVPHEKIQGYLGQADVFVLPSLSEGFPNVILEAMACGLPIVTTKVGGIPDIVTDGVNGYLVDAKNPDAIAEKILILLQNGQLSEEISIKNKEKVKKYKWENVVCKLEKIYLKILTDTGKQHSV